MTLDPKLIETIPDAEPYGPARVAGAIDKIVAMSSRAVELNRVCGSPIEVTLGLALERIMGPDVSLVPQFPWRRYLIDWALLRDGKPLVFVECDGLEFHSSELQIARDKTRDAQITAAGIVALRFTGSEIYRDADAVARIVLLEFAGRR